MLQVVPGYGPTAGQALGRHMDVDMIAFTGSTDVGKLFLLYAGEVVWVNCFDAGDMSSPFGGFKQSGFGCDKSIHALDKFTDLKAVWLHLR